MNAFGIQMENAGPDEVAVTIVATAPIEFKGAKKVDGHKAIYENGTTVEFRFVGTTQWFNAVALRQGFNTASRFFETGA